MPIPLTTRASEHLACKAEAERTASGGLPISSADLQAAGRIARARELAIRAHGRKDTSAERHHFHIAADAQEKLTSGRAERANARWVAAAITQTVALAESRGEPLAKTARGREVNDGLRELAFPRRKPREGEDWEPLSGASYRAGLMFRDVYEGSREDLPSQMGKLQGSPGARSTGEGETWAQRRARKIAEVVEIERKVLTSTLDPRCVVILREVAGNGACISNLAAGSSRRKADSERIRTALGVVADHFKLSDERVRVRVEHFETQAQTCAYADAQGHSDGDER